jgi:hypothetical protein
MRYALLLTILLAAALPARADGLRQPSCNVLIALMDGARMRMIENSFGARFDEMSVSDFDQALGLVAACIDRAAARPPDRPGLFRWEQRSTQLNVLSILSEELNILRTRAYQRERDLRTASSPAK